MCTSITAQFRGSSTNTLIPQTPLWSVPFDLFLSSIATCKFSNLVNNVVPGEAKHTSVIPVSYSSLGQYSTTLTTASHQAYCGEKRGWRGWRDGWLIRMRNWKAAVRISFRPLDAVCWFCSCLFALANNIIVLRFLYCLLSAPFVISNTLLWDVCLFNFVFILLRIFFFGFYFVIVFRNGTKLIHSQ